VKRICNLFLFYDGIVQLYTFGNVTLLGNVDIQGKSAIETQFCDCNTVRLRKPGLNPLNAEFNPICQLLALLKHIFFLQSFVVI